MDPLLAHLLDAAGRAPSAHNTQPWRLRPVEAPSLEPSVAGSLEVRWASPRLLAVADARGHDALHALGALLENVLLTLAQLGYQAEYEAASAPADDEPILVVRWRKSEAGRHDPALYRMIPVRRTSRLPYLAERPSADALRDLHVLAPPCALRVLTEEAPILAVRRQVARATAAQLADRAISRELYRWLRFSPRHPGWHRDGLNADCMGWKRWEAALARVVLAPRVLIWLSRFGLHRALCADLDAQAPRAPAVCLLTTSDDGIPARIAAGRSLQRVWLGAAKHGMVTHPLSAAVDDPLTRPRVLEVFGVGPHEQPVNLFRLGFSATPARSPRLPADEILDRGR